MKPRMVRSLLSVVVLSSIALSSEAFAKPVDLVLRLKERVSMEQLANNVMNPTSSRFGKFYTPEEIRALAAPSAVEYSALLHSLEQRGMKVIHESKSHLFVTVRTDTASKTLSTADLALVDSVTGLKPSSKRHSHIIMPKGDSKKASFVSQADIKKGYGFNPIYAAGLSGKGQHIAVATYDGFHMDDVNGFFKQSKIVPAPVVDEVDFNGVATVNDDSAVETALDAEFSGMMAPGSQIHVFPSAENSDAGELAMFTAILDDNRAQVVNYSWGTCETNAGAAHQADMDKVYSRAVAQGVNIMVASGDSGADGCGDGGKVADWPASSPNVVAVGGTSFTLKGDVMSEAGWVDGGGGVSGLYKLPDYQVTFQTPYSMRSFPDVSFNADNKTGEQVWTSCKPNPSTGSCDHSTAHWMTIGGTSMAAPQWSGFMALVGEARATAGKKALGFLNPILYSMSASTKAKVLHDVITGNNGYEAGPGWDAVTGNGSMQADTMLDYLQNL